MLYYSHIYILAEDFTVMEPFESYVQTLESLASKFLNLNPTDDRDYLRKPHRTLLRIVGIGKESGEDVIDAIIPGWNPHRAVRFPAILLPEFIRKSHMKEGVHLFAKINLGAERASDLYFKDFEIATEPDADDDLA